MKTRAVVRSDTRTPLQGAVTLTNKWNFSRLPTNNIHDTAATGYLRHGSCALYTMAIRWWSHCIAIAMAQPPWRIKVLLAAYSWLLILLVGNFEKCVLTFHCWRSTTLMRNKRKNSWYLLSKPLSKQIHHRLGCRGSCSFEMEGHQEAVWQLCLFSARQLPLYSSTCLLKKVRLTDAHINS